MTYKFLVVLIFLSVVAALAEKQEKTVSVKAPVQKLGYDKNGRPSHGHGFGQGYYNNGFGRGDNYYLNGNDGTYIRGWLLLLIEAFVSGYFVWKF
jgi:hypothetical protein